MARNIFMFFASMFAWMAIVALFLAFILFSLVMLFFTAVGTVAGILCSIALGGLTQSLTPAAPNDLTWMVLAYGAVFGYYIGGSVGLVPACLIFKRKLSGEPLELKSLSLKAMFITFAFVALGICVEYPQVTMSLVSAVAIVLLSGGLAIAVEERGKSKRALTANANEAQPDSLMDALTRGWRQMRRSDWVMFGLGLFMLIGLRTEDLRLELDEFMPAHPSAAEVNEAHAVSRTTRAIAISTARPRAASAAKARTAPKPAAVYIVSTRDNAIARVRACASTTCALMGRAYPGDRIEALRTENGEFILGSREWIAFAHGGAVGYIHSSLLTLSD